MPVFRHLCSDLQRSPSPREDEAGLREGKWFFSTVTRSEGRSAPLTVEAAVSQGTWPPSPGTHVIWEYGNGVSLEVVRSWWS